MNYLTDIARRIIAATILLAGCQTAVAQSDSSPLAITKLSRLLRIPTISVSSDAGDFQMALDTGATGVAIDPRLALILAEDKTEIPNLGADLPLALNLKIGSLSSKVTQVTMLDLRDMRQHLMKPVYGVVGMSVLRDTCLRCDFDQEQLLLLPKATMEGDSADLFFAESGRPHIVLSIGRKSFPVMIDLGSELGLQVPADVFNNLETPLLRTISASMTSSGVRNHRGFKSATVNLGKLQLENVSIGAGEDGFAVAGQKFLSRLNFELDFPNKRMHFQPSQRFKAKDNDIRFGLSLTTYEVAEPDVSRIVAVVAKDSAAQIAGIRPGDWLLAGSSEFYGKHQKEDLYRLLGLPRLGPTKLEVLRDGKSLSFTLD